MPCMSRSQWGRLLEEALIGIETLIKKIHTQWGAVIGRRTLIGRKVLNRIVTEHRMY